MLIRNTDFQRINGLSNRFWGWGRVRYLLALHMAVV